MRELEDSGRGDEPAQSNALVVDWMIAVLDGFVDKAVETGSGEPYLFRSFEKQITVRVGGLRLLW